MALSVPSTVRLVSQGESVRWHRYTFQLSGLGDASTPSIAEGSVFLSPFPELQTLYYQLSPDDCVPSRTFTVELIHTASQTLSHSYRSHDSGFLNSLYEVELVHSAEGPRIG